MTNTMPVTLDSLLIWPHLHGSIWPVVACCLLKNEFLVDVLDAYAQRCEQE